MTEDGTDNLTPLMSDADAYAAADERFEYDEERERDRRHAPIIRRDYPITDADRMLGEQDILDTQRRYKEILTDLEYYELEDMRRQYPPIPLCDTLLEIT